MTVQFITRWTFDNAADLVASFDFTVCQAAIWRNRLGEWKSLISNSFYIDLAGRRLVYTAPEPQEEPGGSMLRVIKESEEHTSELRSQIRIPIAVSCLKKT